MEAIRNPDAAPPRPAVYLRPRIGAAVIKAFGACIGLWMLFHVVRDDLATVIRIDHPFLTAAILVAVPFVSWLVFVHGRTGIRVDDAGLCDLSARTDIRWDEIREIQLLGENVMVAKRPIGLRYAQIKAADGRAIRFADLGMLGLRRITTTSGTVQDIPQNGLLLGLIADRMRTESLFPLEWKDLPAVEPVIDAPRVVPVEDSAARARGRRRRDLAKSWPLAALFLKLGGNFWALLGVGLKTVKIWPALASLGVFAAVFQSLALGAAVLLLVGFHECGHVYAMWRCGVPVKGIYFIPLLGKIGEAIKEYQQALQINPDYTQADERLKTALAKQGKKD